MLSAEAPQLRPTPLNATDVELRPDGVVGAVVSGTPCVVAAAIVEYAPRLPAASTARTRNRYGVLSVRSVLLNARAVVVVPTCAKPVQVVPWHRSTRYPVTPTLSVAAFHDRSIWLVLTVVAVSPPGAAGAVVSGAAGVVAVAIVE